MQLTRAADYAVRVMIHLASQPEGTVISKSILARESEAPESFLSKILQSLARAGLIQARRGVEGGFQLIDRGAKASLLDVVEGIDGPIALNVCLSVGVACHRQPDCAAHQVWLRAQTAMLSVLREAKIADMASARNACGPLLNIASVRESNSLSRQSSLPEKSKGTARRRSASQGSPRVSGQKHNKIN
jgi:Rrf2 family protein